ncbi:helix-turn-helix transcriptional regulator [Streptomyces sp. NPDC088752]|uniref:helix-turn-helix domain-containing protein n=1 Tax=Streptomyces sp. NPDC088752 TaxID=3154963 RepID=UPI0034389B70
MPYISQPTVRKWILGAALTRAREDAGLTPEQAAKALGVHVSTVYRQESGHVAVKVEQIPKFIALYRIEDRDVAQRWTEWARNAKVRGPWAASGATLGPSYRDYADAEDMASELRAWELGTVPGLLQTSRTSEEAIRAGLLSEPNQAVVDIEGLAEHVKLREQRKQILTRESPPLFWAVVGEAGILTPPAENDRQAHREQVQHLLNMSESVSLQVLLQASGLHAGLSGSFSLITIDGLDMVFREGYGDGTFLGTEQVRTYRARYERLQSQALSLKDTRRYLQAALKDI